MPYFLTLDVATQLGHRPTNLLLVDVPLGWLALMFWHLLLRRPTWNLLPDPWRIRLALPIAAPWSSRSSLVLSTLALIVGAVTHLIWDSLTHCGRASQFWPVLNDPVPGWPNPPVPLCEVLQEVSTVLGLGLVGVWSMGILSMPVCQQSQLDPRASPRSRFLIATAIVAIALLGGHAWSAQVYGWDWYLAHPRAGLTRCSIGGISAGLLAWVAYSLLWRLSGSARITHRTDRSSET